MSEDIRIGYRADEQPTPWRREDHNHLGKIPGLIAALIVISILGLGLQVVSMIGAKNMADEAHQQTRHISSQLDEIHRTINNTNPE